MIVELQNPHAPDLPEVRALISRPFDNHPQADGEIVLSVLQKWLGHEKLTVLIVRDDDGGYRGLSIILFPATRRLPNVGSGAPTHSADVGTLWVDGGGVLYINTLNGWEKVGAQ